MKLKFKDQAYQTNAVQMVVDYFAGQVNTSGDRINDHHLCLAEKQTTREKEAHT